jgi:hypothetical protein
MWVHTHIHIYTLFNNPGVEHDTAITPPDTIKKKADTRKRAGLAMQAGYHLNGV